MKKVLILAYDFPPYVSAGGLRPYNWYLNLKSFGYDPIIITRQWDKTYGNHRDYVAPSKSSTALIEESEFGKIIRTPQKPNLSERMILRHGEDKYRFLRRFVTLYYELAQYLFSIGPKSELYREAKKYLKENEVDLILATGEPFVLFHYASKLSKSFNTKWIADYRDSWSQSEPRRSNALLRWWYPFFERRSLKNASAISTVSEYIKTLISPNIPDIPYWIQMNGFNSEQIQAAAEINQSNDILSIGFAGTIYPWHPINNVLNELDQFAKQKGSNSLRLRFFGTNSSSELQKFIQEKCPNLSQTVEFFPKIANEELVKEISKDNLLLLFNDYEILGTKIFNYLGVKRKVLLCYSDDEQSKTLKEKHFYYSSNEEKNSSLQADLLLKTNGGEIVRNGEHLIEVLNKYSLEFSNSGKIACPSHSVDDYTRAHQIKLFTEFMNTLS